MVLIVVLPPGHPQPGFGWETVQAQVARLRRRNEWREGEELHLPSLHLGQRSCTKDLSASSRWGQHSPGSDDAFFQTLFSFLLIEVFFIVPFPFTDPAFVVFTATAFGFADVLACAFGLAFALPMPTVAKAFASTVTLTLASAFTVTGEAAMPPTKLATKPSKTAVFTKLVESPILSLVWILSSSRAAEGARQASAGNKFQL